MYRLTGARGTYAGAVSVYSGVAGTAVHGQRSVGWRDRTSCTLCRRAINDSNQSVSGNGVGRHQSTHTVSVLHNINQKKKYKKQKQYVELLEVNDKLTKETKASVNKLRADHLSKLASSSVSLNQLHQLTTTKKKDNLISEEIDFELLQSIEKQILNQYKPNIEKEDNQCALIFTNQKLSKEFMNEECLKAIRQSYDDFLRSTIKEQRLKDLNCAINDGLNQEFETDALLFEETSDDMTLQWGSRRGTHELFRDFLQEYRASTNQDAKPLDAQTLEYLTSLQPRSSGLPVEEDEAEMLEEEEPEVLEQLQEVQTSIATLNINKSKARMKAKAKKKKREEDKERSMKKKTEDLDRLGKEEGLNKLLVAHLHLQCSMGDVKQANRVLRYYRNKERKHKNQPKINDVKVYNILLQGYADQGDYNKICELLNYMREDEIAMDLKSYSSVLQCLERSHLAQKHKIMRQYVEEMETKGWTLNDMFDKVRYLGEQKACALAAVRGLRPGFEPVYTPPELDYECPLLERLRLQNIDINQPRDSEVSGILSAEQLYQRTEEQLKCELRGYVEVDNIEFSGDPSPTVLLYREKLAEAEAEWRSTIREAFTRNLSTLKSQSTASHSPVSLYPYLTVIDEDEVVDMLMGEIRRLADGSESYSPSLTILRHELGMQLYQKFQIEQYRKNGVLDKIRLLYAAYCEWYAGNSDLPPGLNSRQVWQTLMHHHRDGACLDHDESAWPSGVCQNIGKFLYNIIINEIRINLNMFNAKTTKQKMLPAIYKVHRECGRVARVEVKPHPVLSRLCRGAATPTLRMRAHLVPLVCPPAPWTRARRNALGAYLVTPPKLVRMPNNVVAQWNLLEAAPLASLYPALDSLNQLGEVPWRVNTRILDLQLQLFRAGGSKELDIAPPPSALDISKFPVSDTKASALKRRLTISRTRAEMYSLWCDMLYKLSLANHYRDQIFWLPHNMDFRGRVYACPPHLSQLGADTARALLTFARAEPLGPHGLRWLKLHLVNLTGTMKKSTLDERLAYANSIMEKILDSADKPLDGERWWTESEEPWQTLACCIEIANAVRSPNPEEYLSGFPIHQDGSCNGLQHYAALGGDSTGAASVNLTPLPAPQDVYTAVANKVEEMRQRDAGNGVKSALLLEGFVKRKVIKQTVMTTVYGVTRFGARLQIAKQLKDIDSFPKEHVWTCSSYLAGRTFDSLREMFTSTKLIQDWFTECARAISGVCGESVDWVTPLGLPVVQPYHRRRTADMKKDVPQHGPLDQFLRPCTVKQKNAFPPNFIHSLDSSHMMLTSLYCRAANILFVSVHDCYWTHAHSVDRMNKICREQFVALHSQPILEDLANHLSQKHGYSVNEIGSDDKPSQVAAKKRVNHVLRAVPARGDFELDNVLTSVYFFS